ncbi:MAG: Rrf2 family transcriptional regulator [Lachnospiraceae bacterium]|nr:Rrf2 family transcriptional regulator [Lachnospiraceae bacterium]
MISTRGRYALRVMLDLAQNQGDGYVPMKDVALRQNLSLKYLEQILPPLKQNGMVVGIQGKGGGYRLTRDTHDYTIGEILRITEKDLAPVSCLAEGAEACALKASCKTIGFWEGLNDVVNEYMDSKTLADLL